MSHLVNQIISFLSKKKHSIYMFLKQNGFFDEMVRGIVKLFFFIVVFYCFKEVAW